MERTLVGMAVGVVLAAGTVQAQEPRRLAVLELQGDGDVKVRKVLAEAARHGALQGLEGSAFHLISKDQMQVVLEQMPTCDAGNMECAVDAGRTLQAHVVLGGELIELQDRSVVTLQLHDVRSGHVLGMDQVTGSGVDDLVPRVREAAQRLVQGSPVIRPGGTFSPAPPVAVPEVKAPPPASLSQKVQAAFEEAMRAQKDAQVPPEERAAAWCQLTEVETDNPFIELAQQACRDWTTYIEEQRQASESLRRDYEMLGRYLALPGVNPADRLRMVDEFLEAYRSMAGDPLVRNVQAARADVAAGRDVTLAGLESPGEVHDRLRREQELEEQAQQAREAQRRAERDAERARRGRDRREDLDDSKGPGRTMLGKCVGFLCCSAACPPGIPCWAITICPPW